MVSVIVGSREWLRSPRFDFGFIAGTATVAVGSACTVVLWPGLFRLVLVIDVWLLGYHHVVATFTRFLGDREAVRQHLDLLIWWPLAVGAVVATIGLGVGPWALATIYLYWQWFHYARQSWGIARAYQRKAGSPLAQPPALFTALFYSVPVWGILHRSRQDPERFLGIEVWTLPVPEIVVDAAGAAALALVAAGSVSSYRAWRRGALPVPHTLMVHSHLVVFAVGYIVIDDIDTGWLAINIWHNAQYIAFVWHFNNRRAAGSESGSASLIHRLSGGGRVPAYLLVSVVASTTLYVVLGLTLATVVTPIVVYQAINFHHYIVDAKVWKIRQPSIQRSLGLS